jgi:hypothetical protein
MAALEFPGRALFLHSAVFFFPAGRGDLVLSFMVTEKKKDLPLYMARDIPPPLFVAMNGFKGYSQQFSHFFLRFSQLFPGSCKFFGIQLSLLVDTTGCYS